MPDLSGLPAASGITDDDLLLVYDNGASSNKSRKIARSDFLTGIARNGAAMTPASVTSAGAVTAPSGAIDALTVATSLTLGATLQKALSGAVTLTAPTIAAGDQGTASVTLSGAVVGDQVLIQLPASMPDGLILTRAVVSGANTVTCHLYNASSGSISGDDYAIRATVLRFA